ncbi:MAG: heavy metal translocating P-type ATPase metal-binding domain-containing protein [Pseudomonadota bacterium]
MNDFMGLLRNTTSSFSKYSSIAESGRSELCSHCGTPLSKFSNLTALIDEQEESFCSKGCRAAAMFIADEHSDKRDLHLKPKRHINQLSSTEWPVRKITNAKGKGHQIDLHLPGMYCGSCATLITKALTTLDPKISVSASIETKVLSITWYDQEEKIHSIVSTIEKLGYQVFDMQAELTALQKYRDAERSTYLKRIVVAGIGSMQVMSFAIAHYLGMGYPIDTVSASVTANELQLSRFFELVSMIVASIVVIYSGEQFFTNAWRDIKSKHLGMDVSVALAIGSALFLSVVQTLLELEGRKLYYDSAVMFVFILLIGRFFEARARHRLIDSSNAINQMMPTQVIVSRVVNDELVTLTVPFRLIEVGDQINLTTGDVVPCDSVIIAGSGKINESTITGESTPKQRNISEQLFCGMVLEAGDLEVKCTHKWSDSSIAALQKLCDQAQGNRSMRSSLFEGINRHFVTVVLLLSFIVGLAWWVAEPSRAFEVVLAMLIASCPCAFALAFPVGVAVASTRLKDIGIIVTRSEVLMSIAKCRRWWFDKTGTLTQNKPSIASIELFGLIDETQAIDLIAALERKSQHPYAKAFINREPTYHALRIDEVIGQGVSGQINGERYYVGSARFILDNAHDSLAIKQKIEQLTHHSGTGVVFLSNSSRLLACVHIQDWPRVGLVKMLRFLRQREIETVLVTGDTEHNVTEFTSEYHFDKSFSAKNPIEKLELIAAAKTESSPICMVGDGVNDGPVLAAADIGIALASGTDLAKSQADLVLLNSDISVLNRLVHVSEQVRQITYQNVFWAIAYNLTILPLAAAGLLTPYIAAIGMSLSSLLVVLNAGRIR